MARVWAEIEALGLTAPELRLIEACKAGKPCILGEDRPETPDPARTIRAEVLRYLILGGCAECGVTERGVELQGAYVTDDLELSFATAKGPTILIHCRFAAKINALQTRFVMLSLMGSATPGLNAQGAHFEGTVFLHRRFLATGEVSLSSAKIAGQLVCSESTFHNPNGQALNVQSASVSGGVFLCDSFWAEGEVRLCGAKIRGQLQCGDGTFRNLNGHALNIQGATVLADVFLRGAFLAEGAVDLSGVNIGGQFECDGGTFLNPKGDALNAHGARVRGDVFLRNGFSASGLVSLYGAKISGQLSCDGGIFQNLSGVALDAERVSVSGSLTWRGVTVRQGEVSFVSSHVADLADDLESWPTAGQLYLHGFTYDRISGAFTDSLQRLDWLSRGSVWEGEFFPQPYTQLAKVLREMGHDRGARDVLVEQGRLIALHGRARARMRAGEGRFVPLRRGWARFANFWRFLWDILQRVVIGYGHKPFRSLWALGFLWLSAIILAEMAWRSGAMVPNSDVILNSARWAAVAQGSHPAAAWIATFPAGADSGVFNRYAWGFDVVVPILNVGQTDAWAPAYGRGIWGQAAWWGRWGLSVAGWIVAALAAAAVTGIIQRDRR